MRYRATLRTVPKVWFTEGRPLRIVGSSLEQILPRLQRDPAQEMNVGSQGIACRCIGKVSSCRLDGDSCPGDTCRQVLEDIPL